MSHEVTFRLPTCDLGKADIHVKVKVDGEVFGKLEVSKGAIVWYPKGTTYGHKMTWTELDRVMAEFSDEEKRKHPR